MPALGRLLSAGVSRQSCRHRLQRSAHRSFAAPMTTDIQTAAVIRHRAILCNSIRESDTDGFLRVIPSVDERALHPDRYEWVLAPLQMP